MAQHVIGKQFFHLTLGSQQGAFALQQDLSRLNQSKIVAQLSALFDEMIPEDVHIQLDSLEVDLGVLNGKNWEQEIEEKVLQVVEEQLKVNLNQRSTSNGSSDLPRILQKSTEVRTWELFLYLLEHGYAPWWGTARLTDFHMFESEVLTALRERPILFQKLPELYKKSPYLIKRLENQFSTSCIEEIIEIGRPNILQAIRAMEQEVFPILSELTQKVWSKPRLKKTIKAIAITAALTQHSSSPKISLEARILDELLMQMKPSVVKRRSAESFQDILHELQKAIEASSKLTAKKKTTWLHILEEIYEAEEVRFSSHPEDGSHLIFDDPEEEIATDGSPETPDGLSEYVFPISEEEQKQEQKRLERLESGEQGAEEKERNERAQSSPQEVLDSPNLIHADMSDAQLEFSPEEEKEAFVFQEIEEETIIETEEEQAGQSDSAESSLSDSNREDKEEQLETKTQPTEEDNQSLSLSSMETNNIVSQPDRQSEEGESVADESVQSEKRKQISEDETFDLNSTQEEESIFEESVRKAEILPSDESERNSEEIFSTSETQAIQEQLPHSKQQAFDSLAEDNEVKEATEKGDQPDSKGGGQEQEEQRELSKDRSESRKEESKHKRKKSSQTLEEAMEEASEPPVDPVDSQLIDKIRSRQERARTRSKRTFKDLPPGEFVYVNNAGLVLLNPFLYPFFEGVGCAKDRSFVDQDASEKAVHLLQFLATGEEHSPEHLLLLNKVFCSIPLQMPIEREVSLSVAEKEEAENLLKAVLSHWTALKSASIDGLREGFLQREGKLIRKEDKTWLLQIEQKTIDILLNRLPWGYSIVKLPWMKDMLYVEWA